MQQELWEQAEKIRAEIKRQIEQLSAITGKLQKTADGVPLTPGMTLFYRSPAGIIETPRLVYWEQCDKYEPQLFSSRRAAEEAGPTVPHTARCAIGLY